MDAFQYHRLQLFQQAWPKLGFKLDKLLKTIFLVQLPSTTRYEFFQKQKVITVKTENHFSLLRVTCLAENILNNFACIRMQNQFFYLALNLSTEESLLRYFRCKIISFRCKIVRILA